MYACMCMLCVYLYVKCFHATVSFGHSFSTSWHFALVFLAFAIELLHCAWAYSNRISTDMCPDISAHLSNVCLQEREYCKRNFSWIHLCRFKESADVLLSLDKVFGLNTRKKETHNDNTQKKFNWYEYVWFYGICWLNI